MLMNELDLWFISVVISPGAKFSWGVGNDTDNTGTIARINGTCREIIAGSIHRINRLFHPLCLLTALS